MRRPCSRQSLGVLAARLRRAQGGAAAAEFAVIVPVILLLLTGTINLGAMADQGLALDAAVRAGANFAMMCSYDDPSVGVNCTGMTGSPSHPTICSVITGQPTNPCTSGPITVTFLNAGASANAEYPQYCTWDNDTTTPVDCSLTCDAIQNQCPKHTYITIKATESLSPILEWFGMPESVSRVLTFRVS